MRFLFLLPLVLTAGVLGLASEAFGQAAGSNAATTNYLRGDGIGLEERRFHDQMNERAAATDEAQRAGQRIADTMGVPCTVVTASTILDGQNRAPTGRQHVEAYELVCSEGLGWIVTDFQRQTDEAFDCLALAALANGEPQALQCKLPANEEYRTALSSVFASIGVDCAVRDSAFLGVGGTPPILRYEVACQQGGGYIVDRPAPGSDAELATLDCIEAEAIGVTCAMTAREVQLGKIRDLAAQSGQPCNVVDARSFIAVRGRHLYELSCESGEAYVIEANARREYVRAFPCSQVANIAGGCRFERRGASS